VLRCANLAISRRRRLKIKQFCDVLPAVSRPGNVQFRPHKGLALLGIPGGRRSVISGVDYDWNGSPVGPQHAVDRIGADVVRDFLQPI
jgi:hypothetical protein